MEHCKPAIDKILTDYDRRAEEPCDRCGQAVPQATVSPTCPHCHGTGWRLTDAPVVAGNGLSYGVPCECGGTA